MIRKYQDLINEVNFSKLNIFKNKEISEKFTASIEIELEVNEEEDDMYKEIKYSQRELSNIINLIKNKSINEIEKEQINVNHELEQFIDIILSEIKMSYDDEDFIEDILDDTKYKNEYKRIVQIIKNQSLIYFNEYNFSEFKSKLKKSFPIFDKKWDKKLKFEFDVSLYKGIEISNQTYFTNLDTLFEFISDFYKDYNNQNYWTFNEKTGIHINLGIKGNKKLNFIKGLVFLSDSGDNPFMFQKMEWRKSSEFTKSVLEEIKKDKITIANCLSRLKENKIGEVEEILNKKVLSTTIKGGYKNYGINLLSLEKYGYIEFRYAGGEIKEDVLVDKILYFCYLIYNMSEQNIDRKEYRKKLFMFLKNAI